MYGCAFLMHLGFDRCEIARSGETPRFPIQTQIILTVVAKLAWHGIPEQALLNILFEEYLTAMIQTVATF